jgi:hypothetical protein
VNALLVAVLLAQGGGGWVVRPATPTVGDTVWLERVVPAPAGAVGRARPLTADELVEPLRPPEIVPSASGLLVRYAVAFFATGRHALPMPALEVVHPDGAAELVLGDTAEAEVRALVPDTVGLPEMRDARTPLGRVGREPWPAVVLGGATALGLALWSVWRRRRGPVPAPPGAGEAVPEVPLLRWLGAGERRAVATLAMLRLRRRIAHAVPDASAGMALAECLAIAGAGRPEWPLRELTDILTALERARFAPLAADDLTELVDRAEQVAERLTVPARPEAA